LVKFRLKTNPVGQIYLPKEVREELGDRYILVANSRAAVIFPEDAPLELVIKSLEVIILDLKNRLELEEKLKKR
jgi:bifunctional DNA-binding transcriptional regulator/antitoxin component of YhaV-PrlF toxin-antitoxin module